MRYLLVFSLFAITFAVETKAAENEVFYGVWGTHKQCSRAPIKPGGTVLSQPIEINSNWLRQGKLWCNLSWGPVEVRKDGFFTAAQAQCGEDTLRGYFLGMELSGDNLRLRWGFPRLSPPLARCSKP